MSNAFDLDQGASEPDGNIIQIDRRLVVGARSSRPFPPNKSAQ
jgi:hypothetical protein